MAYSLRSFDEKQDLNDQRCLFELSFPENIGTSICSIEHYNWKFKSFPSTTKSYQYVAYEGSQILGYYAAIPFQYRIDGTYYTAGMVCDVMTHPQARGKGIFTKLGRFSTDEMQKAGIHFTTGYPIRPEVIPGHLKVGWKKVLRMPMYIKILRIDSLLPKRLKVLAPITNSILSFVNTIFSSFNSSYELQVHGTEIFEKQREELNSLFEIWILQQENALKKSSEFLSWRTSAPQAVYKIVTARDKRNGALVGLSIARPTILRGVEVLAILDIILLRDHFKAAGPIFKTLSALARDLQKDALVCMTSRKWAKNYRFILNLMLPTPAVFELIVKKLSNEISEKVLFSKDRWHLFWIDSDDL